MDIVTFKKVVSKIEPFAEHVEYLLKIAKPCVDIDLLDISATSECSRFGGDPFVPKNFKFPLHEISERPCRTTTGLPHRW